MAIVMVDMDQNCPKCSFPLDYICAIEDGSGNSWTIFYCPACEQQVDISHLSDCCRPPTALEGGEESGTVKLPYCQTVKPPDCQTVGLPDCQTVEGGSG